LIALFDLMGGAAMSKDSKSATIVAAIAVGTLFAGVGLTFVGELFPSKNLDNNTELDKPVYYPSPSSQAPSDGESGSDSLDNQLGAGSQSGGTLQVTVEPKIYGYSGEGSGSECSTGPLRGVNEEDFRCANAAQWRLLCQTASLITSDAAKNLIGNVAFDESSKAYLALEQLIDNGKVYNEKISWNDPSEEGCKVSLNISGYVDGDSISKNASGYAKHMIVSKEGEVFVLSAGREYNF
jgi:hypothetical protein